MRALGSLIPSSSYSRSWLAGSLCFHSKMSARSSRLLPIIIRDSIEKSVSDGDYLSHCSHLVLMYHILDRSHGLTPMGISGSLLRSASDNLPWLAVGVCFQWDSVARCFFRLLTDFIGSLASRVSSPILWLTVPLCSR